MSLDDTVASVLEEAQKDGILRSPFEQRAGVSRESAGFFHCNRLVEASGCMANLYSQAGVPRGATRRRDAEHRPQQEA